MTDLGYSERTACRVVGMNRSTHRHQRTRHPSNQAVRRILLADTITELHVASRSTYGTRRMRSALFHERGLVVNRKLIRRIMGEQGLAGLPARKKGRRNLMNVATNEDLVNRNFTASSTNALWLTDITEHKTREGTLYCCAVLDQCSRRIVGWAIDRRNEATLVNDALTMAASSRTTSPTTILHSDHGSQGEFNWPSQHLKREVCDAQQESTEGATSLPRSYSFARKTKCGVARGPGPVLGCDCSRPEVR